MKDKTNKSEANIKSRVMETIKSKKVKMRSQFIFVAEKLGLKSAMALAIILGAIFISLLLYFIEKTHLIKFLAFGYPGFKIFLLTLPYDYILLFALAIVSAIFFANKVELFCGKCERTHVFAAWFLFGALILGVFFGALGIGSFLGGWSDNKIPRNSAIRGEVQSLYENEAIIMDEEGNLVEVFLPEKKINFHFDEDSDKKFMQAIGRRDGDYPNIFHAKNVLCCDSD